MRIPKSHHQNARDLSRTNKSRRASGSSFLIVVEGERTEIGYFTVLRDILNLTKKDVVIYHPAGTDPETLIRSAATKRDEQKVRAKRDVATIPFDSVWVVFDLEEPSNVRRKQALDVSQMNIAKGINIVCSNPCFEYWLLLHEQYTTGPFASCGETIRRLRKYLPAYLKAGALDVVYLRDRLPEAITRAMQSRTHHKGVGGDHNASTEVDFLVRELNDSLPEAKRQNYAPKAENLDLRFKYRNPVR